MHNKPYPLEISQAWISDVHYRTISAVTLLSADSTDGSSDIVKALPVAASLLSTAILGGAGMVSEEGCRHLAKEFWDVDPSRKHLESTAGSTCIASFAGPVYVSSSVRIQRQKA
jgi:hypothetical protein